MTEITLRLSPLLFVANINWGGTISSGAWQVDNKVVYEYIDTGWKY